MKLTDSQKRYTQQEVNKQSLEHLKNQLSSNIKSTLSVNAKEEETEDYDVFANPDDFRFDMFANSFEISNMVEDSPNALLDFEKEIEKLDDKINIFVKKDGILKRKDTVRQFLEYVDSDYVTKNKDNIYYIPSAYLIISYLNKIELFTDLITVKYPEVTFGKDSMIKTVKSLIGSVLNIESSALSKKILVNIVALDSNIDSIMSIINDSNLSMTNDKIVKFCQDIGTFHHNFESILKDADKPSIRKYDATDNEIIFRQLSKPMIRFIMDIYKTLQYDFYLLQKNSETVFWKDVKGIIQNIDTPIKSLKVLDISANKHFEIITKLKKSHKLNAVLNEFPDFNLYEEFSECLFKIAHNELARYNLFETSIRIKNMDISSESKVLINKYESMINDNLKLLKLNSI